MNMSHVECCSSYDEIVGVSPHPLKKPTKRELPLKDCLYIFSVLFDLKRFKQQCGKELPGYFKIKRVSSTLHKSCWKNRI